MTGFFRVMLFISSYSPLYLLIIVNIFPFWEIRDLTWPLPIMEIIVCGVLLFLFVISFSPIIYISKCELNETIESKKVRKKHEETLSYLVTYIVPLLVIDITEVNTLITNMLLFLLIGFLYVKSNMIHINVLFLLFGWNIYEDSKGRIIITMEEADYFLRQEKIGVKLMVRNLGGGIYLHRK
ncbi:hypothetical protein [Amphibacillus xylanus]|uniref:Uncharacterized protein n=1 Tax=Amphibacillus xylanus (strain ATCC 51415 / DSM 6626 / JCM 7361 / LMG 17667 / NBRC 15112 / Ep01) TaxID=698758 RepID=K0J1G8_AMPXN|nr:hypothetical protein [Amphibacillus xylanus]BAM46336.1 hypothetical protein AXY_02040 [Amphibacillus xylanus NBRC 15112]